MEKYNQYLNQLKNDIEITVILERRPFAEGFSPTVATVEPFFPFPSVNRVKSAIANAMFRLH
jgi:hypothetical protein